MSIIFSLHQESSLPAAVFVWTIENNSTDDLDISIMFSFKNGRGVKEDKEGGCWNEPFKCDSEGGDVSGVLIHQTFRDMDCTYALSAAQRVSSLDCREGDSLYGARTYSLQNLD